MPTDNIVAAPLVVATLPLQVPVGLELIKSISPEEKVTDPPKLVVPVVFKL